MFLSLIRGALFRLTYQLIIFAAGMLIAAMAGPSEFGIISLMIVNAAAFIIISSMGADAAIVWHISGNTISHSKAWSFALGSGILQISLFLLVQFIISRSTGFSLLSQQSGKEFIFYELIYFFGLVLIEKYTGLLYGHNKASLANKTITITAFIFLLILILSYLGYIKLTGIFLFFCIMTFAVGLTLALVYHFSIQVIIPERLKRLEWISMLSFSAIVFLTNTIQFFAYRLDFWLVDHFHGINTLGIYAQSNRFAQLLWVIPAIVAGLLTPVLRQKVKPLSDQEFAQVSRLLNVINLIVTGAIIITAWIIYNYFLQQDYFPGWKSLLYMLPGYFLFAITTLLATWFSVKRLLYINLIGSTLCFIVIATADLLLIPRFSINGAAFANTIGYSITTFYFVYQYRKRASPGFRDLLVLKKEDTVVINKLISR